RVYKATFSFFLNVERSTNITFFGGDSYMRRKNRLVDSELLWQVTSCTFVVYSSLLGIIECVKEYSRIVYC
ncbi:hypothetical protein ACJX0J_025234, partial [Zea mays]